jgi:hypothetical protein
MKPMKSKRTFALTALAALIFIAGQIVGGSKAAAPADNRTNPDYKGGSTFNLVGAAPNVARCGPAPENIELSFTGSGIDTEGGSNTAVFPPAPTQSLTWSSI